MPASSSPTAAGGALIALGAIAGAAIGYALREPTIGFLGGMALGVAASLLIWWRGTAR